MELENKKFRCHVSIIFEECATFIASMLVLAFLNIGDMFGDDSMTGSDALYAALAIAGLITALLLFVLVRAVLRWRKTTITIDRESIVWERNTLNKKKLTIGIKSISTINVERNIFERIIGTAKLKIDTNSLSTANTTDVTFLFKHEEALKYKAYLESMVRAMEGENDEEDLEEDITEEHFVHAVSTGQNLKAGNSNAENLNVESWRNGDWKNRSAGESGNVVQSNAEQIKEISKITRRSKNKIMAEYVADEGEIIMHCIYDISLFSLIVGGVPTIWGIVEIFRVILGGNINIGDLLGAATIVITFGYATFYSVLGKLFRYHGLTVRRSGNRLHMKYGLFKIREYVIPVEKINAIHINQTMIGRIFHRYNVTMDCVGVADENNEIAQLTLSLPYDEAINRVSHILPEYDMTQVEHVEKISPKAFLHKLKGVIIFTFFLVCFMIGAGVTAEGQIDSTFIAIAAVVSIVIYVFIAVSIVLQMKTEGSAFGENHMVTVTGSLGKDIMLISYKKIQYASTDYSPLSKYTGLVLGHINILAAGANTIKKIPYINEDKVEFLKEKMCRR